MNRKLIDLIRREFFKRLERKTGWGRNDLKLEFEAAIADALAAYLDTSPAPQQPQESQ